MCVCIYMYIYIYMYMYVYICMCVYHARVLECGLRAFHSLLSNTLERGGGMIFFTKKSLSFIVWKILI